MVKMVRFHFLLTLPLALILVMTSSVVPVASFTPISSRPSLARVSHQRHVAHDLPTTASAFHSTKNDRPTQTTIATDTTTTSLQMNFSRPDSNEPDPTGLRRGFILFGIVLVLNAWLFSIPPEFRRARFCTEEDVKLYPDSKCITFGDWKRGIQEYYANGGGIEFDFSIDPDSRK